MQQAQTTTLISYNRDGSANQYYVTEEVLVIDQYADSTKTAFRHRYDKPKLFTQGTHVQVQCNFPSNDEKCQGVIIKCNLISSHAPDGGHISTIPNVHRVFFPSLLVDSAFWYDDIAISFYLVDEMENEIPLVDGYDLTLKIYHAVVE